ncbi:putative ABC transporter [Aspergillus ruber CBS 135680]|uniref:Putative ABC transporter n=1 Tax=Aspergillus ruber (strain CBS 135680) TaxID=1388766 RepID=A0A017SKJ1_ASPRC|nr:putative ABC transporter [Aspergillus ruber CBS 135680]EYE96840.1 putative ABC transporter [Aspergillus ruber CBS 135680]
MDNDLENNSKFLLNETVNSLTFRDITVSVNDRDLIKGISGDVQAGQLVALMGPSGSGKTTLLNVLARRAAHKNTTGNSYVNNTKIDDTTFNQLASYVEQEDALIGSLNVWETLQFAADLALPHSVSKGQRKERIQMLLNAFGIQNQAKTLIGTPIRKGISGGQKRRVSVASQLMTCPKILFLDEPTSGLDSTASYEVISYVRELAKANNLIIIASIHQPSTSTFQLFDTLLLLSGGRTCYFGPIKQIGPYFAGTGYPLDMYTNPAEFLLDLVSSDFVGRSNADENRVEKIQDAWLQKAESSSVESFQPSEKGKLIMNAGDHPGISWITLVLLHRAFIKSYRDVVAYGIRIVMYLGLAIMMGTVWLRLDTSQEHIQPFTNAIFFGSAFMSFMAVAYVPAFLEDRATFVKERANGLYGATPFILANFIIGLPFLFIITILFSIVAYWLSNFTPTATAFFTWMLWLFLDLLAAESLVVFVTALLPNFVLSLAVVAFANGLWMSVGGFLVPITILNPFWHYVFHYIDYQAYVFQGMMVNEFGRRNYSCGGGCRCMYSTDLEEQCLIRGTGVLEQYGYGTGNTGKWVGILVGIIAGYRILGWLVLIWRR